MAAAAMQSTAAAATAAAATTTVAAAAAAGAAATVTVADRGARQQRHHWGVSRPLATFALLQAKGSRVVRLPRCVRVFWLNKKKKTPHLYRRVARCQQWGGGGIDRPAAMRPPERAHGLATPTFSSSLLMPLVNPRPLARTKLASVSLNVPRPAAHSAQRGRVRPALGRDQRAAAAVAKGTRGAAAPRPQAGGRSVVCRHCRRRRCRRRQLTPSPLNVPFSPPQGPATSGKTVPSRPSSFG